ncbi:Molybdenum cofactor synthesis protein 3 [Trapelia coarctata]|nr:Molybdenum cofactor synthesis protein 3 [Trapelia coarctata]
MLTSNIDLLRTRIGLLEAQLHELKQELSEADRDAERLAYGLGAVSRIPPTEQVLGVKASTTGKARKWPLDAEEYVRYGRQMIMPEIGLQGSSYAALLRTTQSPEIFCPYYWCTIGLVDGDVVEWSNLHRQILHNTERVGQMKVDSAITGLRQLNPKPHYVAYPDHLTPTSAAEIMKYYDIVLDCTDHPSSRYLISDAAVLSGKPLVSGSALKTEGQLLVLNYPPSKLQSDNSGPCYRCVFPKPPPAEAVVSCGEGGILGPVVGVIGVLMALKAIQVLTGKTMQGDRPDGKQTEDPATMLLFSAYSNPSFRHIRLAGKRRKCAACSSFQTITTQTLTSGSLDYATICGIISPVNILQKEERVEAKDLKSVLDAGTKRYALLDVRDETQYAICPLPGSINIPISTIQAMSNTQPHSSQARESETEAANTSTILDSIGLDVPIYTVCRFGNDSQLAVRKLKELGYDNKGTRWIGDVKGGLRAWKEQVDPEWPEY